MVTESWGCGTGHQGPGCGDRVLRAVPLLSIPWVCCQDPRGGGTGVVLVAGGPSGSPCPQWCPGRFKATLWLCEQHPLSLAEQVTPIIDLMAISNAHFAKLRDFITLKLPPGFPVKIGERESLVWGGINRGKNSLWPSLTPVPAEIPLFHVLNARITFSNLCGCDQPLGSVRICAPQEPSGAHPAGTQPSGSRGEAGGARGALPPWDSMDTACGGVWGDVGFHGMLWGATGWHEVLWAQHAMGQCRVPWGHPRVLTAPRARQHGRSRARWRQACSRCQRGTRCWARGAASP